MRATIASGIPMRNERTFPIASMPRAWSRTAKSASARPETAARTSQPRSEQANRPSQPEIAPSRPVDLPCTRKPPLSRPLDLQKSTKSDRRFDFFKFCALSLRLVTKSTARLGFVRFCMPLSLSRARAPEAGGAGRNLLLASDRRRVGRGRLPTRRLSLIDQPTTTGTRLSGSRLRAGRDRFYRDATPGDLAVQRNWRPPGGPRCTQEYTRWEQALSGWRWC